MPEAVRITLWLDANPRAKTAAEARTSTNEPPLVFQTVARLNLAAGLQESLASGASAEGSSPTGNPASPAGTNPGGNR
jgi:hypothetical protein